MIEETSLLLEIERLKRIVEDIEQSRKTQEEVNKQLSAQAQNDKSRIESLCKDIETLKENLARSIEENARIHSVMEQQNRDIEQWKHVELRLNIKIQSLQTAIEGYKLHVRALEGKLPTKKPLAKALKDEQQKNKTTPYRK